MEFDIYKNRLREYLLIKGIDGNSTQNIKCFSPNHEDNKPSCQIFDDFFKCYSCGIHGDIYDAVEILEGITDKAEQFKHIQNTFGDMPDFVPVTKKEYKLNLIPENDVEIFENYLTKIKNEKSIRNFVAERAKYISNGKESFSPEVTENFVKNVYWWNGIESAKNDGLSEELLTSIGGIYTNKDGNLKKVFNHSGVLIKTGIGYKLHYYSFDKDKNKYVCRKFGGHGSKGFPCPTLPLPEKIVIVEGELKAIFCHAAGLKNVFSCGGVSSLTGALIKEFIVKKNVKEITIFFDNDNTGIEKSKDLAKFLIKNNFTGIIKIAKANELQNYKDQDEAILYGHTDFVVNAIEKAEVFSPEENATSIVKNKITPSKGSGNLTERKIDELLKKIDINNLSKKDKEYFLNCIVNSGYDYESVSNLLVKHGINKQDIPCIDYNFKTDGFLDFLAENKIPKYTISKLRPYLTNQFSKNKAKFFPIVDVNVEEVLKMSSFQFLIDSKNLSQSEIEISNILEVFLINKFIYVKERDEFYFFDGLIWEHRSDIASIAYNIMGSLITQYFSEEKDITRFLNKMNHYNFCKTVMNALSEKESIYRERIDFDSDIIKETLTLQDGVLDFSGKKIKFRDAKPSEYRQKKLPYFVEEVKAGLEPVNFMKFMNGNFDNKDTLNSLMYFLSLIPSRSAKFKIGGIFTGKPHTGKTTTMEIIADIYPDMTVPIPRDLIMNSKYGNQTGGANPFLAQLEGAGAGISDETEKNDHLNSSMWKSLTGGGKMTARGLWQKPHNFIPTAQTIILTNYSPLFDKTDQAVIDRMLIVQFSKQHEKGEKGTMTIDELKESLRPEYPAIVKMFAEYYVRLKNDYKSKIPQSQESIEYKNDYIENMDDNGLQNFMQKYTDFAKGSGKWVLLKDVYARYCQFWNIDLDSNGKPIDPDKLTQAKFTRYLKRDYNEFKVKQMRVNGYPEQVVVDFILKDWDEVPEQNITIETPPEEYEENPFDDSIPDDLL